ncbi:hypothetical protein [Pseudomonas sp. Os17]|uniref:hypothetical protein n=1 Tax=Pseudomonas sp. Os17 TaxID=1500686 RepID=UPI00156B2790
MAAFCVVEHLDVIKHITTSILPRGYEGWLYLAVVLDLFSRQVVGWSMKSQMTSDIDVSPWWCLLQLPLLGGESYDYCLINDLSMVIWPDGFSTHYSMGVVWGFRFLVSLAVNCQASITGPLCCGVLAYISI